MKISILCVFAVVLYAASGAVLDDGEVSGAELAACDRAACNRACWAFGWAGGNCVGSNCKCFKFLRGEERLEGNYIGAGEEATPKACSPYKCQTDCRKIGANGGMCVLGKCVCT